MSTIEMVREFHDAFGVVNHDEPNVKDRKINRLRLELLSEELRELSVSLGAEDKSATLDALIDIQYVLDGAFLQLGFASVKDAAFLEVHKSNMAKLGPDGKPIRRADGKVLKPEGWKPPNLEQFV